MGTIASKTTILFLFLLAGVTAICQSNLDTKSKQDESTQFLFWNEKPDVRKWLQRNEARLQQGDGCSLTVSWYSQTDQRVPGSAVHEIVTFAALPDSEEDITRMFHDTASNSGLDVRVGVRYIRDGLQASKSPPTLELAIALEGSPEDVFAEISRSEAGTIRFKNWRLLSLVKPVIVKETRYEYRLSCENGIQFLGVFRRPLKKQLVEK